MNYVNPGIIGEFQPQAPSMGAALQQGVQLKDLMSQMSQRQAMGNRYQAQADQMQQEGNQNQQAAQRQQAFSQALNEEAQKVDFTTSEGQKQLVQNLGKRGFTQEALALHSAFPEASGREAYAVFKKKDGSQHLVNKITGKVTPIDSIDESSAPTATPAAPAAPWKGEKFVRSKDNRMVKIDANGNDQNGDPVDIWQKPDKIAAAMGSTGADVKANQADASRLSSRNKASAARYLGTRDALAQAEAAYAQYKQAPNDAGVRANQLEIVDKFTATSANRPTTEGQFNFMTEHFPGIQNYIGLAGGKFMVAKAIPDAVIDSMMKIMRGAAIVQGVNLKKANQTDSIAGAHSPTGAIDASRILSVPNNIITSDSTQFANAINGGQKAQPVQVKTKAQRDALPSGTVYIGPDGHTATKP